MELISGLLMMRYRPPKRDRAAILYQRFVRKTGISPRTGETPAAFADRARTRSPVSATSIDEVTELYLDARYGSLDPASLQQLESAVAALR